MKLPDLTIEPKGSSGIEIRAKLSKNYNLVEFTLNDNPQPIFISPWMQFEPSAMNDERLAMAWEIARRAQDHDRLIEEIEKLRVKVGSLYDSIDGERETLNKTYDVWKAERAKLNLPADFSDIPNASWPKECMGDYRPPRRNAELLQAAQAAVEALRNLGGDLHADRLAAAVAMATGIQAPGATQAS